MDDAAARYHFYPDTLTGGYFNDGFEAYLHGIPRDPCPITNENTLALGLDKFWHSGWDCGQLEDAMTLGSTSDLTDVNPYPVASAAAAYWIKGWRYTHTLTGLPGP